MNIEELRKKSLERKKQLDDEEKRAIIENKDRFLALIDKAAENGDFDVFLPLGGWQLGLFNRQFVAEQITEWLPGIKVLPTTLQTHLYVSWREVPF